jgi:hypothetical protein
MINKIIGIYAITDDILKAIGHQDDCRRVMTDAEVLTTAFTAALFFNGNQALARQYLGETGLIPRMLDKSRFCRRLHQLSDLIYDLFHQIGMIIKQSDATGEYLLDSFPVAVCDNIRIRKARLVRRSDYRGYIASKKRYFYGIRVQLLSTSSGIPVEFVFLPGAANDVRAFAALPLFLPAFSQIYADSAYTDYQVEDDIKQTDAVEMKVFRKKNSRRIDPPWEHFYKQVKRHRIETVFSDINKLIPKSIHAVTLSGFFLKVSCFIVAFTFDKAFL